MNANVVYSPGDGSCWAPNNLVGPPYTWQWPEAPFVYTYRPPVQCGPIHDPYCPSRQGVVGLPDSMGYPTCCCPASGKCHTSSVVPIGDPPHAIVTWPFGPFAYLPRQMNPPFY